MLTDAMKRMGANQADGLRGEELKQANEGVFKQMNERNRRIQERMHTRIADQLGVDPDDLRSLFATSDHNR